jgi:DNA helicase IV
LPDRPQPEPELDAEQVYVDAAYARLEAMRAAAERVRAAYSDVRAGGTHQARLERDIAWDVTQRRLADLDIGDSPLVFGRLDLDDGATWYIGRLAVEDDQHTPLVVDWRAPVAEPFYRATAIAPMGVVRRRHLITKKGREITGVDDEVFDQQAIAAAGLEVAGEGALLAALERNRTGRMGDIVATIQAEQDQAIRADLAGVLVVAGGPGTGKTAVALHRAAYLLYTHRRRLAASGVLLIGPSAVFLRYIEQVLPSLGEQDVQLSTLSGLKRHVRVTATEPRAAAQVKGDARMAEVIERAVADRERALPAELILLVDGLRLRVTRSDTARIVDGVRKRRGTHNEKRPLVVRRFTDLLVTRYKNALTRDYRERRLDAPAGNVTNLFERDAAPDPTVAGALSRGEAPPEGWEQELRANLRGRAQVKEALERMWPVLSGVDLLDDLFGFRALVHSAADGILSDDEQALLHRRHERNIAAIAWTEADIALVDEADALLGPVEAARPRKRRRRSAENALDTASRVIDELGLEGFADAGMIAGRYGDSGNGDAPEGLGDARTFAHVLVDEAQDLTAMQWRMLARRVPSGSMTLVGDPGQASQPGAVADWDDVLALVPTHNPPNFVTLSVNYRTPAEVMDVASRLLAVAAPTIEPSRSVRATGEQPRFISVAPDSLISETVTLVREAVARTGTIAVIAPTELHGILADALAEFGAATDAAEALDAAVAVLDATAAKGLEFDHVVVVEPNRLVTPDRPGLRLLYVTITRTTKTLAVVHAESLPEGLRPDRALTP